MEREKGGRTERRFALKNAKGLSERGAFKILPTVLNNNSYSPFLLVFCNQLDTVLILSMSLTHRYVRKVRVICSLLNNGLLFDEHVICLSPSAPSSVYVCVCVCTQFNRTSPAKSAGLLRSHLSSFQSFKCQSCLFYLD